MAQPPQHVRIFLCSTYSDLIEERAEVLRRLAALQLTYGSMEHFGAESAQPIDVCLSEVRKASIVVVIVGHKYGTRVPSRSMSFTEAEYQEAVDRDKHILVYMRREDVAVLPKDFERNAQNFESLEAFKRTLNKQHTVARFAGPVDLADAVQKKIGGLAAFVEKQLVSKEQETEAVFGEIKAIVTAALGNGVGEAALVAVVRSAVATLTRPTRSRTNSALNALRSLVSPLQKRPPADSPWTFFSYAHADKAVVASVAAEVERLGIRVWLDQEELALGDSLLTSIRGGLEKADALVFFASKDSLRSNWAMHELDYFSAKRVTTGGGPPLIPVVLDDVELPLVMRDVVYIDFRSSDASTAAQQIASSVRRHTARRQ